MSEIAKGKAVQRLRSQHARFEAEKAEFVFKHHELMKLKNLQLENMELQILTFETMHPLKKIWMSVCELFGRKIKIRQEEINLDKLEWQ